jgi:cytochrome c oxidase assembly factor CtaG
MILTGEPLPPELTPIASFLTEWRFDVLWGLIVAFLAFFYLAGVWRLQRRGDSWPCAAHGLLARRPACCCST